MKHTRLGLQGNKSCFSLEIALHLCFFWKEWLIIFVLPFKLPRLSNLCDFFYKNEVFNGKKIYLLIAI